MPRRMISRLISSAGSIGPQKLVEYPLILLSRRSSILTLLPVLGYPYDPSLDVWSVGCTLFELYTGKILFPGRSNNQMLLHMMELKGRFNSKMIKRAKFGDSYFDEMGGFDSIQLDRVTGSVSFCLLSSSKTCR
jgi:serine/threonine protein kinase